MNYNKKLIRKFQVCIDTISMDSLDQLFEIMVKRNLDNALNILSEATQDESDYMRRMVHETLLKRKLISAKDIMHDEIKEFLPKDEAEELFKYVDKLKEVLDKKYHNHR